MLLNLYKDILLMCYTRIVARSIAWFFACGLNYQLEEIVYYDTYFRFEKTIQSNW